MSDRSTASFVYARFFAPRFCRFDRYLVQFLGEPPPVAQAIFTEDVIASGRPTRKVATRCCLTQARFLCFFEQIA
jgi:hypothetical protein